MKVKVCGVNDGAFARAAEAAGADYLGFVFEPSSPRNVTAAAARSIADGLAGAARLVGVFVRQGVDEIDAVMRGAGLQVVQLHRRASADDVASLKALGYEVWTLAGGAAGDAVLFDSTHGDGERRLRRGPWRTVLAGGLGTGNLAAAAASGADVLDFNSSLETAPGRKSAARLRELMDAVARLRAGRRLAAEEPGEG